MNVVLAYKNFAANRNISHIGLGVAAINTAKVLRREGIKADVWPVLSAADLRKRLAESPADHVVISAPWIPSVDMQALSTEYPETHFAVNCHSNVGFLQADRNGVKLVREMMELETGTHNVHLGRQQPSLLRLDRCRFRLLLAPTFLICITSKVNQ